MQARNYSLFLELTSINASVVSFTFVGTNASAAGSSTRHASTFTTHQQGDDDLTRGLQHQRKRQVLDGVVQVMGMEWDGRTENCHFLCVGMICSVAGGLPPQPPTIEDHPH